MVAECSLMQLRPDTVGDVAAKGIPAPASGVVKCRGEQRSQIENV